MAEPSQADLPVTDLPSFVDYNAADVTEVSGVQFTDINRVLRPCRLGAADGGLSYHYVFPGINPVARKTSKKFSNTLMPGANDVVVTCTPRKEIIPKTDGSPWEQKLYAEPVLDGQFIGLSSGYYADFNTIPGVTTPFQSANVQDLSNVANFNVNYFWNRIGDIVSLQGRVAIAGTFPGNQAEYNIVIALPIPLPETVAPFAGAFTYVCSAPTFCQVRQNTQARGHDARDPRFFGMAQMVQSFPFRNDGNTAKQNEWPIYMWPVEWSRNLVRITWLPSDEMISPEIQFTCSYSLQPIMYTAGNPSGATLRRVVDKVPTSAVPTFPYS